MIGLCEAGLSRMSATDDVEAGSSQRGSGFFRGALRGWGCAVGYACRCGAAWGGEAVCRRL